MCITLLLMNESLIYSHISFEAQPASRSLAESLKNCKMTSDFNFIKRKIQYFKTSHVVRDLLENACYVIVISLAQDYVEVKEKFVPDTESVLANLASEAVEMIDVLTSPHYHFQRWYCLGTM